MQQWVSTPFPLLGSLRSDKRRHVLLFEREWGREGERERLSHLTVPGAPGLIHGRGGALRLRQDKIRHASVHYQLLQAELSMLGDSRRLPWSNSFTSYSECSSWIISEFMLQSLWMGTPVITTSWAKTVCRCLKFIWTYGKPNLGSFWNQYLLTKVIFWTLSKNELFLKG